MISHAHFRINAPIHISCYVSHSLSFQVATNGYIVFGDDPIRCCPPGPFSPTSTPNYILAPFWADADPSVSGRITYHTHEGDDENLKLISDYLSEKIGSKFYATWALGVSWMELPQFGRFRNGSVVRADKIVCQLIIYYSLISNIDIIE